MLIDSVIVPLAMIGCLLIGTALGITDAVMKAVLFIGPLFLLEPMLVAYTGGTIGHHLLGLRVQKQNGGGNINLFAATSRFVVKTLTGWFSFLLILTSRKHQALHDMAARTVVVHRDAARVPAHEALLERKEEEEMFTYPPPWRRVLVILGYNILILVALEMASLASISYPCLSQGHCSGNDEGMLFTLDMAWLVCMTLSVLWAGGAGCGVLADVLSTE